MVKHLRKPRAQTYGIMYDTGVRFSPLVDIFAFLLSICKFIINNFVHKNFMHEINIGVNYF